MGDKPARGDMLPDTPSGSVPDLHVDLVTSSSVVQPYSGTGVAVGHVSSAISSPSVHSQWFWASWMSYTYNADGSAAFPSGGVLGMVGQLSMPVADQPFASNMFPTNGALPTSSKGPVLPSNSVIPENCDNVITNVPVSTHSEGTAGDVFNSPASAHSWSASGGVNISTTPYGGNYGFTGGNVFSAGSVNSVYSSVS